MPKLIRQYFIALGGMILLLPVMSVCAQPGPVTGLTVTPYDHHVEITWDQIANPSVQSVRVYGAIDGSDFTLLGSQNNVRTNFIDFLGDFNVSGSYYLRAVGSGGQLGVPSDTVSATTFEMSDSALLDMVQAYTLRYFYDFGHPVSGLARERNTSPATVTSGGSGFGIMALIVGAERGFITYEQALQRTTKIVDFLLTVPRFRGAFSHWINGATGLVIPFSQRDDGGDLVETSFLLQGLLTAKQYYTNDTEEENTLRANIDSIYGDVNWNWYRKQVSNVLFWHWSPTNDFAINLALRGFNEVHIAYILGIASPVNAHRIPAALYHSGWAGGDYETSNSFYGIPLLVGRGKGGPLFFSHYSYLGFDPRNKKDRYTNYFERNRNHTLINYNHCIDNPYNREGYGPEVWGITASDDPDGYLAHAPDNPRLDNGTIAPTAAIGSMPYTPEESMAALKHFYRELGDRTWGEYGFFDAFNQGRDWYADSYLAIDQGPIICMIENHRSGLLWDLFMRNPEIAPALEAIGFESDSMTTSVVAPNYLVEVPKIFPNPLSAATGRSASLSLSLNEATTLAIDLIDAGGRIVQKLRPAALLEVGEHQILLDPRPRPNSGHYFIRISGPAGTTSLPLLIAP